MKGKQNIMDNPDSFKSGGQRIEDHTFWAGAKGKSSVFPDGPYKTKDESSAEGVGSVMKYEDTTEAIRGTQIQGSGKVKTYPLKPGTRN